MASQIFLSGAKHLINVTDAPDGGAVDNQSDRTPVRLPKWGH
jgi:hypothetical protein